MAFGRGKKRYKRACVLFICLVLIHIERAVAILRKHDTKPPTHACFAARAKNDRIFGICCDISSSRKECGKELKFYRRYKIMKRCTDFKQLFAPFDCERRQSRYREFEYAYNAKTIKAMNCEARSK